jgi:predicted nucleic acid-binding protein
VDQLRDPQWHIENLSKADLYRAHQLLEQYADATLDFVDATIVAMAERLNISLVLTLDRRDFGMIRPRHVEHFTILP